MEIVGGLITKWLPTQVSPIAVREQGDELTVEVGGAGRIESRILKDEAGRAMTLRNSGFASVFNFDDLSFQLAPSGTRWTDPEMPRHFETRSGGRATWNWKAA